MIIREEQMQALSDAMMEQFVASVVAHLLHDFPDEIRKRGLERQSMPDFVRARIVEARGYGVEEEEDLRLYVDCTVLRGPQFPNEPWAEPILNDPARSGGEKMGDISEYMLFGLSEDA